MPAAIIIATRAAFNGASKVIALVLHCYALLLAQKSRATLSTIRSKLNQTNRGLPARVFPRLD